MCNEDCKNTTNAFQNPTDGYPTDLQLKFQASGTSTNYGKIELRRGTESVLCCQTIDSEDFVLGIHVTGAGLMYNLVIDRNPLSDRLLEVKIPAPTNNHRFEIRYENGTFYFIGTDDVRSNYGEYYYIFRLSGADGGVNIRLKDGYLYVMGGH